MQDLPAPAAQISRVEFPALLTESANQSRRRCGPDRPPCCGARRQNRSSWISTENTQKAMPCAAMEAKRQVTPEIVARPLLLYRLGHRRLPPVLATWRSGDAADCKSVHAGSIPAVASNLMRCYLSKNRSQPIQKSADFMSCMLQISTEQFQ